ncbi:hypothetical protein ACP70R_023394 [Stipagrostis hirtigluma subsp. patula]
MKIMEETYEKQQCVVEVKQEFKALNRSSQIELNVPGVKQDGGCGRHALARMEERSMGQRAACTCENGGEIHGAGRQKVEEQRGLVAPVTSPAPAWGRKDYKETRGKNGGNRTERAQKAQHGPEEENECVCEVSCAVACATYSISPDGGSPQTTPKPHTHHRENAAVAAAAGIDLGGATERAS